MTSAQMRGSRRNSASLFFMSVLTDSAVDAAKRVRSRVPKSVLEWVQDFETGLQPETLADQQFEFRVYLVPPLVHGRPPTRPRLRRPRGGALWKGRNVRGDATRGAVSGAPGGERTP